MNYLISNWSPNDPISENDPLLILMKLFQKYKIKYQGMNLSYAPFFRYQVYEHNIKPQDSINFFDLIQGVEADSGHPLALNDLSHLLNYEKVYTPSGVRLLEKNQTIGEVYYNNYGHLAAVDYTKNELDYRELYDARGFLSSLLVKDKANGNFERIYYNEYGKEKLIETGGSRQKVEVLDNNLYLTQKKYPNFNLLIQDFLKQYFISKPNLSDTIITLFDDFSIKNIKSSEIKRKVMRLAYNTTPNVTISKEDMINLTQKKSFIVTDMPLRKEFLEDLGKAESKKLRVKTVPLFATQFALGKSNEVRHLKIYWRVVEDHSATFADDFLEIIHKVIDKSSYSLTIEVQNFQMKNNLEETRTQIICDYFHVERQQLKKYHTDDFDFLYEKELEKLEKENRDKYELEQLAKAVDAHNRTIIKIYANSSQVREELSSARILLDLENYPSLMHQAMAVSSGIPIICQTETYYTVNKNSEIIKSSEEIIGALDYFLLNLSNWNNALVENVRLIEAYDSTKINTKWSKILDE